MYSGGIDLSDHEAGGHMTVGLGDLIFGIPLAGVAIQNRINQHRAGLDRVPVFVDTTLSIAANRHTSDMAANPRIYKTPNRDAHISSTTGRRRRSGSSAPRARVGGGQRTTGPARSSIGAALF